MNIYRCTNKVLGLALGSRDLDGLKTAPVSFLANACVKVSRSC